MLSLQIATTVHDYNEENTSFFVPAKFPSIILILKKCSLNILFYFFCFDMMILLLKINFIQPGTLSRKSKSQQIIKSRKTNNFQFHGITREQSIPSTIASFETFSHQLIVFGQVIPTPKIYFLWNKKQAFAISHFSDHLGPQLSILQIIEKCAVLFQRRVSVLSFFPSHSS